jgi:hypothetical protein
MSNATTASTICPRCDGKGRLEISHCGGLCFTCWGSGAVTVSAEAFAAAQLPRADAIARLATALRVLAADDGSGCEEVRVAWLIARAPADVAERAFAAASKTVLPENLRGMVELERSRIGVRFMSARAA